MNEETKLPAADVQCEKAVIGYIVNAPTAYQDAADLLTAEMFTDAKARRLYDAITAVVGEGDAPDITTVTAQLLREGRNELVPILADCYDISAAAGAFPRYCARLIELWQRRQLFGIGRRLLAAGVSELQRLDDVKRETLEQMQKLDENTADTSLNSEQVFEQLYSTTKANASGLHPACVHTGLRDWDALGGLHYSDLTIIAAYPGQGKTALAIDIMTHIASNGTPVAFFSAEMPAYQIAARMVAPIAAISPRIIMQDPLTESQTASLDKAVGVLSGTPFYIDESPRPAFTHIVGTIRALHRKRNVRIFFIDYLQLLNLPSKVGISEERQYGDAVKTLKQLAKELDVCIVLLSQLSRNGIDREPKLSKLRGSGQIEEGADVVVLLYRPMDGERYSGQFANVTPEGTAEVIIAKGRNIGTAQFIVGFDGATTHFHDIDTLPILADVPQVKDDSRPF